MSNKYYIIYEYAKQAVRILKIKTREEYKTRYSKDPQLPQFPDKIYDRKGWVEWYDFLKGKPPYKNITQAKQAAKEIGFASMGDYRRRYSEDPKLTLNPQIYYQKAWGSWADFLNISPDVSYQGAKQIVKKLRIKTCKEYTLYYKKDKRLPADPSRFYQNNGWISWYNLFDKKAPNYYRTYEEARRAVIMLNIKSFKEYGKHWKKDPRLSSRPQRIYKNKGWINWFNYLNKKPPIPFYIHNQAKRVTKKLGITTNPEFRSRYKEDPRLPSNPQKTYKTKGWIDWRGFFNAKGYNPYSTYTKAKKAVKRLGIKSMSDYTSRYKKDPKLYSHPETLYKTLGWVNWYSFLDKKAPGYYRTYKEARKSVIELNIKTCNEYRARYKEDPKLPSIPYVIYKNIEWIDWYHYLGKKRHNTRIKKCK